MSLPAKHAHCAAVAGEQPALPGFHLAPFRRPPPIARRLAQTISRWRLLWPLAAAVWLLAACTTLPEGVVPVSDFRLERYLGKWYEVARLDHSFERGLSDVTAHYRLQPDGSVEVLNRGYNAARQCWQQAAGRAVFIAEPSRGSLKVSFFGPFYGAYHIAALDQQDYRWALVVGPSRDYLWILSREPHLPDEVREALLRQARELNFAVDRLIWVTHRASGD